MIAYNIARRLNLSRGGRRSVATTVSTVGVAVAVCVMLLTVAVTGGFNSHIKSVISSFDGQLTLTRGGALMGEPEYVADDVCTGSDLTYVTGVMDRIYPGVTVSGVLETAGMLKTRDDFEALRVYAHGNEALPRFVSDLLPDSVLARLAEMNDAGIDYIVMSTLTADMLGLNEGDKVNLLFFADGNIRMRNLEIIGLFNTNFPSYDRGVSFVSPDMIREVVSLDEDEFVALRVEGMEFDRIAETGYQLSQQLWSDYLAGGQTPMNVTSILEGSAQMFSWLELLDMNVVVIIFLIGLIALFTLMATLFILVIERTRMIGVMKSMGASDRLIRHIFILLIGRIILRGLIWGNVIAISIIVLQSATHMIPLDAEAYFVPYVPVSVSVVSVLIINIGAICAAMIAMILPSAVISRMSPSRALRFE